MPLPPLLDALLETHHGLLFITTPDGRLQGLSQGLARAAAPDAPGDDVPSPIVLGTGADEALAADEAARAGVREAFATVVADGRVDVRTLRTRLGSTDAPAVWSTKGIRDGDALWLVTVVVPVDAPAPAPDDVVHAPLSGDAIAPSEALIAQAFENAPIGKALVTLDGRFSRVNAALCDLLGRDAETLLRCTFQEITHPDDLGADLDLLHDLIAGRLSHYRLDKRYFRPDGSIVHAQLDVTLVRHADGRPFYFVSQIQDVSALRQAEQDLRDREATLRHIYESAPVMLGIVDIVGDDLVHRSDNPATEAFFGVPRGSLTNRRSRADLGTSPEVLDRWTQAYREAVRTRRPVEFEYAHTRGLDDERTLRVITAAVGVTPDGHDRCSYVAIDVTQDRRREAELVEAREAALAADQAKSAFLAVMSHEIRTPLNSVLGFGELLFDTPLDPEQREMLTLIRESGTTLLRLISDILDLSKIEAGRIEVESRPVNFARLIGAVCDTLRPRAREKNIEIVVDIAPSLPQLLLGDEVRLRQVFANYLTNALKFTEAGRITVRASAARDPDAPRIYLVHVSVTDTGIGIPADRMDRLFRTFSQVDASTTRKFGGTGLGLAIVQRLARLMGGDAWAESTEGVGSTFHVTFRLQGMTPVWASTVDTLSTPAIERGETMRVLVADDIPSNRLLLRTLLRRLGLTCDDVENGSEAVSAVRTALANADPYEVVLMDVQMPEMDGLQATRAIRASIPAEHQPRIIAVTADALSGDSEKCKRAGMDDYLAKPFTAEQLVRLLWTPGGTARRSADPSA